MRKQRTIEQIGISGYIRQSEIMRYFCLSRGCAKSAYLAAEKLDDEKTNGNRIFPTMVRLSSVYEALGLPQPKKAPVHWE